MLTIISPNSVSYHILNNGELRVFVSKKGYVDSSGSVSLFDNLQDKAEEMLSEYDIAVEYPDDYKNQTIDIPQYEQFKSKDSEINAYYAPLEGHPENRIDIPKSDVVYIPVKSVMKSLNDDIDKTDVIMNLIYDAMLADVFSSEKDALAFVNNVRKIDSELQDYDEKLMKYHVMKFDRNELAKSEWYWTGVSNLRNRVEFGILKDSEYYSENPQKQYDLILKYAGQYSTKLTKESIGKCAYVTFWDDFSGIAEILDVTNDIITIQWINAIPCYRCDYPKTTYTEPMQYNLEELATYSQQHIMPLEEIKNKREKSLEYDASVFARFEKTCNELMGV